MSDILEKNDDKLQETSAIMNDNRDSVVNGALEEAVENVLPGSNRKQSESSNQTRKFSEIM